jgi:membrane protease YdiL (CAAX protease family)
METTGAARIVGYFGAGVYEEVLFRLALIPLLAGLLRALGDSPRGSLWGAAVAASLIFSAAHYRAFTQVGDAFSWDTFLFRFAAGMIFSAIFIYRGFGISAGAHTLYDVAIAFFAASTR